MSIRLSVMLEGHLSSSVEKISTPLHTGREREREHIISEKEEERRIKKEGGKEEEVLKEKQRKREQEREREGGLD